MKIRGAFSAMALTALLAIPLFGFTNHSTSIHAANIGLAQNTWHGSWENKVGIDKWDAHPSKIYMHHDRWMDCKR